MSRRGGSQQPEQYHASTSARRGGDGGGRGRGRGRGRGGGGEGRGGGRGGPSPGPATSYVTPQTSHTPPQAVSRPPVQTPSSSAPQPASATTSRAPSAPQPATALPQSPHQAMIRDTEKKLFISEAGAPSSKALVPPKRPGFGTVGRKIMVKANHFAVKISDKDLYHYDVSISPEVTSKKVNRDVISTLVKLYRETHLGRRMPAYDGRKSLYTAGPLPFETKEFVVKLVENDNPAGSSTSSRREREFKVAIKFAAKVDGYHLQQFLSGRQRDAPQDIIQILDIVLRAVPSTEYVVVGRSFFSPQLGAPGDLGDGIEYWRGYYQSLRPTQMGLSFNIDVSARGFYEPILVTDFVAKYFNLRDLSRPLSDQNRLKVKKALKGIKVRVSYREYTKTFKITGISLGPVSQTMFLLDDKKTEMSVQQYFRERYNIALRYSSLPALQTGSDAKSVYLPMELCSIVEGQRYSKRLNEKQVNNLLIATCERPLDRERNIQQMVSKCNFSGRELVSSEFGIDVNNAFTLVEGRVLPPPMLKYHDSGREVRVDPQWGQWNMINKKMVNGGVVDCWACVNFSYQVRRELPDAFCRQLVEMCESKGMVFSQNPILPIRSADARQIERTLNDIHHQSTQILSNQGGKQLQLLIIILPDIKGSYGKIKRICETELGIVSQCCQPKQAMKLNRQYLENVALKINVKVGGRNTVLNDAILRRLPLVSDVPTIIFGADVTHPPPGEDFNPSIAAVVASMDWPEVTKYRGIVSAQAHREEIIQDLYKTREDPKRGLVHEGMIRELLLAFRRATQHKPHRIIFYRDGVSEGQFSQVLLHEIIAIRKACESLETGYQPRITFVVVQKRHHTRFFPADHGRRDQMDRSGNILPGTVVDKQICHPTEFDFYLNSHAGIKGTSRPSHYHVLFDENGFSADALQTLTNNLCYTYARCTRSVSLVPPAYYAHLAAFRARYYIERETSDTGSTSGRSATGSSGEVLSLPTIKENVKNVMFYC